MVDEPVDHRGGDDLVAEHLAPAAERLVAGDDQAVVFLSGRRVGRTGFGGLGFERDVADLVDLCGYPHRSTYADTATMPRRRSVVGRDAAIMRPGR